ncbi:MAG: hypothetical protein JNM11_03430 [Chitinimonas sp.]|nr:hypothetical protein [Chitinimonas sp.]
MKLRLDQFNPYAQAGFAIVWQGDRALVWYWDAAWMEGLCAERPLLRNATVYPESLFGVVSADGAVLLQRQEGVEGQFWVSGTLLSSRWWPESPALSAWNLFLRDNGAAPVAAPPALIKTTLDSAVWGEPSAIDPLLGTYDLLETVAYAGSALLLLGAAVWYQARISGIEAQTKILKQRIAQSQKAGSKSVDLEAMRVMHADMERVAREWAKPSNLALMNALGKALPTDSVTLIDWDYQAGKLRMVLSSKETRFPTEDVLQRIENLGLFENIRSVADANARGLTLSLDVKGAVVKEDELES